MKNVEFDNISIHQLSGRFHNRYRNGSDKYLKGAQHTDLRWLESVMIFALDSERGRMKNYYGIRRFTNAYFADFLS